MKLNRKLLTIIGLWNKEAQKDFQVFLASPYFNKGVQAPVFIRFYDLILKYEANPEHRRLGKEAVAKYLFGDETNEEKRLNKLDKLGTGLLDLAELYLAQKEYENEQSEARKLLASMKFFRKHQNEQRFWQAKDAAYKALDASPWRDAPYYFDAYALHQEVANMNTPYSTLKKDLGIDQSDKAFDRFFVAEKLQLAIIKKFQTLGFNADHQSSALLDAVLNWQPFPGEEMPAIIELQKEIVQMLDHTPDLEAAIALEQRVSLYKRQFPFEFAQFLYTCCRNIITLAGGQFHQNMETRLRLFEISKRHLEEGYLLIDGKISTTSLRTLLTFSLNVNQPEWAKKLLEDFPPEQILGTKHPEELCRLNWAYYYFFLKDYENAEKRLQYSSFENQLFGFFADIQLIKIYYETQNELLDARLKALDQKNRRSTQPGNWMLQFSNFMKLLEKLIRVKERKDPAAEKLLLEEVRGIEVLYQREWFLEKLGVG